MGTSTLQNVTPERSAPSPNGAPSANGESANGTAASHSAPPTAARARKTPSPAASNGAKKSGAWPGLRYSEAPARTPEAPATPEARDAGGRFTKGNPGGPGNPFARRVAALRCQALDAVTPQDVRAIVTKLVELGRAGNVPAAKLVLAYTVGKPAQTANPDTLDVEEWDKFRKTAPMVDELASLIKPDSSMLLAGLRTGVQCTTRQCADFLGLVQKAPHKKPSALIRQWQKKKRRRQQAVPQANGDGDSSRS
jgi:hypothetical protein